MAHTAAPTAPSSNVGWFVGKCFDGHAVRVAHATVQAEADMPLGRFGVVYCTGLDDTCEREVELRGVHGTVTATTCGSSCRQATSAECSCSCGGGRHGETATR